MWAIKDKDKDTATDKQDGDDKNDGTGRKRKVTNEPLVKGQTLNQLWVCYKQEYILQYINFTLSNKNKYIWQFV